jgi:hypothetical protein
VPHLQERVRTEEALASRYETSHEHPAAGAVVILFVWVSLLVIVLISQYLDGRKEPEGDE